MTVSDRSNDPTASSSHATASPSMMQERTRSRARASTISGKALGEDVLQHGLGVVGLHEQRAMPA